MSIFYKICPHDCHTCADRNCLDPMRDTCTLVAAQPTSGAAAKPANTADQIKKDEYDYGDTC